MITDPLGVLPPAKAPALMHRDHTAPQDQDWGRRRLRAGCAKAALDIKRRGWDGTGLRASAMAEGHSERTLERWAEQRGAVVMSSGMDFCRRCHKVPEACRCR